MYLKKKLKTRVNKERYGILILLLLFNGLLAQEVGIGISTPKGRLHVEVPNGYSRPAVIVTRTTPYTYYFVVDGTTGNVGIGILNPTQALDVSGNVQFSGSLMPAGNAGLAGQVLVSQGAGNPPQWQFLPSPGDSVCSAVMNNYLQKWTGTKLCNSIIYDDGSRIGIGTTSPLEKLHVFGNSVSVLIGDINTGKSSLRLLGSNSDDYAYVQAGTSNSDLTARLRISRYYTATSPISEFQIYSDTTYFSGKVGIGTQNPQEKLHIVGNAKMSGSASSFIFSNNDANPNIISINNVNFGAPQQGGFISVNSRYTSWPNWTKTSSSAYDTAMFVKLAANEFGVQFGKATNSNGVNPGVQVLTVKNNGKVGINTRNPQALLHIVPQGVTISTSSASRNLFVYSKDTLYDSINRFILLSSFGFTRKVQNNFKEFIGSISAITLQGENAFGPTDTHTVFLGLTIHDKNNFNIETSPGIYFGKTRRAGGFYIGSNIANAQPYHVVVLGNPYIGYGGPYHTYGTFLVFGGALGTRSNKDVFTMVRYNYDNSKSALRLYIEDDGSSGFDTTTIAYKAFEILGNSCGGGQCGNLRKSATLFVFDPQGNAYKPGGGSWLALSDSITKKIYIPFSDGIGVIRNVNPIAYKYKHEFYPHDRWFIGVMAQELAKIAPYMVDTVLYRAIGDTLVKVLVVDPSAFTYILINAVKYLDTKVQKLEEQIEFLERKNYTSNKFKRHE